MLYKKLPRLKKYEDLSLPYLVSKPWGWEKWIELWQDSRTKRGYCLKLIFLKANEESSLQYHKKKVETQYIIQGKARVSLENEKGLIKRMTLEQGAFFTVIQGRKHKIKALNNLTLLEVSTPEVDDVIRIKDNYNRK